MEEFFAVYIEYWEANDSSDGFYSKIIQTLNDIVDFSIEKAINENIADNWGDEYRSIGNATVILVLVGICRKLITALFDWLTNNN